MQGQRRKVCCSDKALSRRSTEATPITPRTYCDPREILANFPAKRFDLFFAIFVASSRALRLTALPESCGSSVKHSRLIRPACHPALASLAPPAQDTLQ